MGRETKVGLLAGLTFITCFAVILANRGKERFSEVAPWPSSASKYSVPPPPAPQSSSPSRVPVPAPYQTPATQPTRRTPNPVPRRRITPRTTQDPVPAAQYAQAPQQPAKDDVREVPAVRHQGQGPAHTAETSLTATNPPPFIPGPRQPATRVNPAEQERLLRERLARLSAELAATQERGPSPANSPANNSPTADTNPAATLADSGNRPGRDPQAAGSRQPAGKPAVAILAKHSVQKGDTLTRIAHRYYGSSSAQFVNAIFDANRAVVPDPDQLRIGDEVVIPALAGAASGEAAQSQERVAKQRPAPRNLHEERARTDTAARWYQVRKNDRYITIAREQLGDENRWKEIFELNRERFPDPSRIREGVRIRIPNS